MTIAVVSQFKQLQISSKIIFLFFRLIRIQMPRRCSHPHFICISAVHNLFHSILDSAAVICTTTTNHGTGFQSRHNTFATLKVNSVNGYNAQAFRLHFCRTNIKQFSVFYQGPKFYNSFNTDVVNSTSPASFKKALKAFICDSYSSCNLILSYTFASIYSCISVCNFCFQESRKRRNFWTIC